MECVVSLFDETPKVKAIVGKIGSGKTKELFKRYFLTDDVALFTSANEDINTSKLLDEVMEEGCGVTLNASNRVIRKMQLTKDINLLELVKDLRVKTLLFDYNDYYCMDAPKRFKELCEAGYEVFFTAISSQNQKRCEIIKL